MGDGRILLVEGRGAGNSSLAAPLMKVGFEVILAHTGNAALAATNAHSPDLIVFDACTMRSNGVRTCRRLRRTAHQVRLIHCRPQSEEAEPDAEADVYLRMPFTSRKLLNRIRALLPVDPNREQIIRAGGITFYRQKRLVVVRGQPERTLTPKQAQLLETFLRHAGTTLDRKRLMEDVWNTSYVGDTRTLDVHVRWIRECIEEDPAQPVMLQTVRGVGYRFELLAE